MASDQVDCSPLSRLSRSAELLWGSEDRPSRGPKPALSLERIVDVAITIADAESIDGLSMRRLASELGVGTMSLYRYVPGKAELLNLMLDRVHQADPAIQEIVGVGWRETLELSARMSWKDFLSHPWLLQVNLSRPVLGPNILSQLEFVVAGLDELGLTDKEKIMVTYAVDSFVAGMARTYMQSLDAPEETGVSDEDFWAYQMPVLEAAMETGRYPTLAALDEDAFYASWEELFEFGLQRVLDGLAAFIPDE